jgi:ankyrin repeat protein
MPTCVGHKPEELATGPTPLHHLSYQADPQDRFFHKNQVILWQQLFRHGANANLADVLPAGRAPLHIACHSRSVTNLDFIQLLLEMGASPNVQNVLYGMTPVMPTIPMAPGAAKFLLEGVYSSYQHGH